MEDFNGAVGFTSMDEFEDSQWDNATVEERQDALKSLVNALDQEGVYDGYSFQTANLPDGDFVSIDPETNTITFDQDALSLSEARDSIISDLFGEMNVDERISDSFKNQYQTGEHVKYSQTEGAQYTETDEPKPPTPVSFGCLGICGMKCINYRGSGRAFQVSS